MPEAENPLPAQEAALLEFQLRVEDPPVEIEAGLADKLAVGAGEAPTTKLAAVHGVSDP